MVEKLKIGPTLLPFQKVQSSQANDVTQEKPKETEEGIEIPVDVEKVTNEAPNVVEDDSITGPKQSTAEPEDSTARPKDTTTASINSAAKPIDSTSSLKFP